MQKISHAEFSEIEKILKLVQTGVLSLKSLRSCLSRMLEIPEKEYDYYNGAVRNTIDWNHSVKYLLKRLKVEVQ